LKAPVKGTGYVSRVLYPEATPRRTGGIRVKTDRIEGVDPPFLWPLAVQHKKIRAYDKRFHWRTFRSALAYLPRTQFVRFQRRAKMAWKAPKIVEVPVGMEINMYACAARK
jgi:coenzyme PQQ precursor peptide PqqA